MSNYIDRDILLEELNEAQIEGDEYYKGLGKAKRIVCEQPNADVQEVKHGDWELIKKDRSKCSECGFQRNIETQFGWKFCPMCGADMGVYKDNE